MRGKKYAKQIIHWRMQGGIIPIGKSEHMKQIIKECVGLHMLLEVTRKKA